MMASSKQTDIPPSSKALRSALSHPILTSSAQQTTLSSILNTESSPKQVLVIFIRNFLCGLCQQYLTHLSSLLPPSALPRDLSVVVIGCGAPSLIDSYANITQCPYPIYTDPSAKLYEILGMTRTLSTGSRNPEYLKRGVMVSGMKSVVQGLRRLGSGHGDILEPGEMNVVGGEFLFVRGEVKETGPASSSNGGSIHADWNVKWCHRMRNTRDHTEVHDVKVMLGLATPSADDADAKNEIADFAPVVRRATTSKLQRTLSLPKRIQLLSRSHTLRSGLGTPQRSQSRRFHSHVDAASMQVAAS